MAQGRKQARHNAYTKIGKQESDNWVEMGQK